MTFPIIPTDQHRFALTHGRNPLIQKRNRYQQGSLQVRKHGRKKMWVLLYRDGLTKRYRTLGPIAELTKSDAQREQSRIMEEVNSRPNAIQRSMTFGQFVERVALPFLRPKWKLSTRTTNENLISTHLTEAFKEVLLSEMSVTRLQEFLQAKADAGYSESVVAHCRWNLSNLLRLAVAEGYIETDPTTSLYIPKCTFESSSRVMQLEQVPLYLDSLEFREQVIASLAIFTGLRPGEILALQRKHVQQNATCLAIEQRIYAGNIDTPKTEASKRTVAVPPATATQLRKWMDFVPNQENAWVFSSENAKTPIRLENLWRRHFLPKLKSKGLGWATFQVLRRTHASLGQDAGIDPKVAADQRGHGIGVSLDVYTKSAFHRKMAAAEQLEKAVINA